VLGFVLPYLVILLGWSLAPDAVREHYHPDGDRIRDRIGAAVLGSTVVGVLLALPWASSSERPASWWAGAVVALVVQVVGVFCFNVWYYVTAGGAFP
jgi:hypothetical protein